jgi:hypothetical protein
MPIFKSAVEKASVELTRLRELRVSLEERERKARSELEQLKAGLAGFDLAAMLDDGTNGGAAKSIATTRRGRIRELEDEIETCLGIERPLIEKLHSAMRAVNVARADEIRKQAGRLQKTLDEHSAKVAQLQTALELLEECPFRPEVKQVVVDSGERGFSYAISLSARLQNQITALHAEAAAIENKKITGGGASAETLDELLAAVNADPDTIPPLASTIRAWFAAAFKEAEADFRRADYGSDFPSMTSLPVEQSIALSWNESGEILPGSAVKLRLAPITRQVAAEQFGAEYALPLSD